MFGVIVIVWTIVKIIIGLLPGFLITGVIFGIYVLCTSVKIVKVEDKPKKKCKELSINSLQSLRNL